VGKDTSAPLAPTCFTCFTTIVLFSLSRGSPDEGFRRANQRHVERAYKCRRRADVFVTDEQQRLTLAETAKTSVALCPDATRRLLLAARHGATRALFNSFARMPAAERVEVAAIVVLSGNRQSTPASFSFNNVTR
jgi:hypothetical protein